MTYLETKFGNFQAARSETSAFLGVKKRALGPDSSHVLLAVSHLALTEPYITENKVLKLTGIAERTVNAALRRFEDKLFLRHNHAERAPRGRPSNIYIASQTGEKVLNAFQTDRGLIDDPGDNAVYLEAKFGDFQAARSETSALLNSQGYRETEVEFDDSHVLLAASYLLRSNPYITIPAIVALTGMIRKSVHFSLERFTRENFFARSTAREKKPGRGGPSTIYEVTQTGNTIMEAFQRNRGITDE